MIGRFECKSEISVSFFDVRSLKKLEDSFVSGTSFIHVHAQLTDAHVGISRT